MSERVYHPSGGRKMVKQSEASACDINNVLKKWIKSGVVPITGAAPRYGDFSNVNEYHATLSQVQEAQEQFMRLPSAVRKRADNDPGMFLDLVFDEEGRKELLELGLDPSYVPEPPEPVLEPPVEPPVEPPE